jgi:hypothetical protein
VTRISLGTQFYTPLFLRLTRPAFPSQNLHLSDLLMKPYFLPCRPALVTVNYLTRKSHALLFFFCQLFLCPLHPFSQLNTYACLLHSHSDLWYITWLWSYMTSPGDLMISNLMSLRILTTSSWRSRLLTKLNKLSCSSLPIVLLRRRSCS